MVLPVKFYHPFDLRQNELRNSVIERLAAAPTDPAPVNGQMFFSTVNRSLYVYDETLAEWLPHPGIVGGWAVVDVTDGAYVFDIDTDPIEQVIEEIP